MKFLGKSSSQVSVDITLMKSKLRESHLSNVNPISTLLGRFSLYRQHMDIIGDKAAAPGPLACPSRGARPHNLS